MMKVTRTALAALAVLGSNLEVEARRSLRGRKLQFEDEPFLQVLGNNGDFESYPLGLCQGECDTDDDCQEGLYCFQRNAWEEVPGCPRIEPGDGYNSNADYCIPRPGDDSGMAVTEAPEEEDVVLDAAITEAPEEEDVEIEEPAEDSDVATTEAPEEEDEVLDPVDDSDAADTDAPEEEDVVLEELSETASPSNADTEEDITEGVTVADAATDMPDATATEAPLDMEGEDVAEEASSSETHAPSMGVTESGSMDLEETESLVEALAMDDMATHIPAPGMDDDMAVSDLDSVGDDATAPEMIGTVAPSMGESSDMDDEAVAEEASSSETHAPSMGVTESGSMDLEETESLVEALAMDDMATHIPAPGMDDDMAVLDVDGVGDDAATPEMIGTVAPSMGASSEEGMALLPDEEAAADINAEISKRESGQVDHDVF